MHRNTLWMLFTALALVASGCEGPAGADGTLGSNGTNGTNGTNGGNGTNGTNGGNGTNGANGTNGVNGTNGANGSNAANTGVKITDRHGMAYINSTGDFASGGKFYATAKITKATADAAGKVTVTFSVMDKDGKTGYTKLTKCNAAIAKLVPGTNGSPSAWVPYHYRTETVSGATFPKANGFKAEQGYREASSTGTFTNNKDGTYTYVYGTDISKVKTPVGLKAVTYDRKLTHRVTIMFGGHSGATAETHLDFVPDGTSTGITRDIIATATCQSCHGEKDFHGHGGDRLTVEGCVMCHNPSSTDAQSGETLDMTQMIHKIHAGHDLPSIPGTDGIVFDDPSTTNDESADNGSYAIWGYKTSKHSWEKAAFPAVLENCTKCHTGTGKDVLAYSKKPSRAACGSCHDDVNFATGVGHSSSNLKQLDDKSCFGCHPASGTKNAVMEAHDWMSTANVDPRNSPEFTVAVTVSKPANTTHFVKGEKPVASVVIKDLTGKAFDHTKIDKSSGAEGCLSSGCPTWSGKFNHVYLFLTGPRGNRNPVLSTKARAKIVAPTVGPYDLSAASAALDVVLDSGKDLWVKNIKYAGNVTIKVSTGTFSSLSAATPTEVMTWLNGDAYFKARAIAYLQDGKIAIRSRNLGTLFAVQLKAGAVTTAVFGGDTAVKTLGGYYVSNDLAKSAATDPKVSYTVAAIKYTMDAVDDLKPGTYVASLEIAGRGRKGGTDYKSPSVAWTTFQVGTATTEKPVANNCKSCHQNDKGKGYVLDFARHYKLFGDDAIDQCGACHDYQPRDATGSWAGGHPITKRVHAIHYGAELQTPNETVAYTDPVKGRFWDITLPMDVRNCEACHTTAGSSGSWKTKAARLPCSGCHDSAGAKAHFKLQTFDPTPTAPFSGDEEESCQVCH